MILFSTSDLA